MRKMMDFSFGMMKNMHEMYGLSEEQAKMFSELGKEKFPAVRGLSFVLGVGQGDEPIFARMLGIMRVDNRETFLAEYEKFLARYNRVVAKIKSPMFQPARLEKTEIDGAPALKVTMKRAADAQYAAAEREDDGTHVRARRQDHGLGGALRRAHRRLQLHGPRASAAGDRGDQGGQAGSGGRRGGCQGCGLAAARRRLERVLQPQGPLRFRQSDDGCGVASWAAE